MPATRSIIGVQVTGTAYASLRYALALAGSTGEVSRLVARGLVRL